MARLAILLPLATAACTGWAGGGRASDLPASSPCLAAAKASDGTVAGAFPATIGAIRALAAVDDNPQLAGYPSSDRAVVCYIDAEIPKGPPSPPSGTSPPSFNRALLVVVGDRTYFIVAGYRQTLPVQSP